MKMHRPAPDPGEPYLTCFDCGRALTLERLTLFPWWDERVDEFDAMYRCDRCLPRAHKQLLRQLTKNEKMLSSFLDFTGKKVGSSGVAAPHSPERGEALEYARQVLDKLVAHQAFVQGR